MKNVIVQSTYRKLTNNIVDSNVFLFMLYFVISKWQGDDHTNKHQYDHHVDENMTLPTNDIDVSENDNDDDETMVGDHMVQMVNDVYQCFNENLDVNCK